MMLSTKKEDRFVINGTTSKLTLYIKNLIQAVEDKIANSPKLIEGADTWTRYKNEGLATVADRTGFHKSNTDICLQEEGE